MKNTLKVIVALLVFIVGIVMVDKIFVKEEKKEEEKVLKKIDFQLSFMIDSLIGEYESIEFTEEEKEKISSYIANINYEEVYVDLAFLGDYKLVFDSKELIFDDNDDPYGLIKIDERYSIIEIKELKEALLRYIQNKNLLRVYLYERNDLTSLEFKKLNLLDEDKKAIKNLFGKIRDLEEHEYVNLAISGKYNLIVDNEKVYFDDLDGYAMKANKMVKLDDELIEILKKYVSEDECCSCCPDLEPGEACIDACCPCN